MEKYPFIIGITGGTGCGKTTLLGCIQEKGGLVLDCDAIYHRLLQEDDRLLSAIDSRFPGVVEQGVLQRKTLGNLVFSDKNALADLNKITHAAIKAEVQRLLQSSPKLAAIDAIALFESGLAELCHTTVAVIAPEADRVQRLMARDGISREYAEKRIAAQHSSAEFSAMCHHTLVNDGDICAFRAKCLAFLDGFAIM